MIIFQGRSIKGDQGAAGRRGLKGDTGERGLDGVGKYKKLKILQSLGYSSFLAFQVASPANQAWMEFQVCTLIFFFKNIFFKQIFRSSRNWW